MLGQFPQIPGERTQLYVTGLSFTNPSNYVRLYTCIALIEYQKYYYKSKVNEVKLCVLLDIFSMDFGNPNVVFSFPPLTLII